MSRRGRLRGWSISGAGHRGKMLSTWRKGAHWLTMAITSARGGPRPTSWTAELGRRRRSRFSTADSAPWAPLPASAQRLRLPLTPLPVPGAPGFGPASPLRFPLAISVPLSAPRQLFSALPRPAPSLYLWLLSPHLSPLCPSARAPLPPAPLPTPPAPLPPATCAGGHGRWLRCRLGCPLPPAFARSRGPGKRWTWQACCWRCSSCWCWSSLCSPTSWCCYASSTVQRSASRSPGFSWWTYPFATCSLPSWTCLLPCWESWGTSNPSGAASAKLWVSWKLSWLPTRCWAWQHSASISGLLWCSPWATPARCGIRTLWYWWATRGSTLSPFPWCPCFTHG